MSLTGLPAASSMTVSVSTKSSPSRARDEGADRGLAGPGRADEDGGGLPVIWRAVFRGGHFITREFR